MNSWKECPSLFSNGKFKAKIHWGDGSEDISVIDSYFCHYPKRGMSFGLGDVCLSVERCILIARQISDMTDKEKGEWRSFHHERYMDRMIPCYANQTAYLLSIGVYPFDQNHFQTGEVININDL